jgi:hypothetical protein
MNYDDLAGALAVQPQGERYAGLENYSLMTRRTAIKALAAGAAALGMLATGWVAFGRKAGADPLGQPGYTIFPNCSGLPSWAADSDDNGCSRGTPATADMCFQCDTTYPFDYYIGYHKPVQWNGYDYRLRSSRQCGPSGGESRDGWKWEYQHPVGYCTSSIEWRCHDGQKVMSGTWQNSVCKWITKCNANYLSC